MSECRHGRAWSVEPIFVRKHLYDVVVGSRHVRMIFIFVIAATMNAVPLSGDLPPRHCFTDPSATLTSLASNLAVHLQNLTYTHIVVLFSLFWFLFTLYAHFIRKLPAQISPLLLLHSRDPTLVINERCKIPIGRVVRLYGADQADFLQNSDRSSALMYMENSVDFRFGLGDVLGLVWHVGVLGTLWSSEVNMIQEWFGRGGMVRSFVFMSYFIKAATIHMICGKSRRPPQNVSS